MSMRGTKGRDTREQLEKHASRTSSIDQSPAPKGFAGVFQAPASGSRPKPPAKLTEDQEAKLAEMLRYFRARETYPTSLKGEGSGREKPATDWEKLRMLSRESMLRYLRATKWDVTQAKKRLTDTIAWRREFGVDEIDADEIEPEAKSGKETVLGFDNSARPLHYMHPHRNDTKETPRQMRFAVWILECCIDMMPPGVEQLALLINFDNKSRNPTSIANAKLMLYILQNHYVERLGVALCINVPWVFKAFWNAIQPLIDPVTKSKCKFDEDIKSEVPSEQLSAEYGGSLEPKYNHEKYWPELVKVVKQRREQMTRRFKEQCNSEVGASEWVIRGGNDAELQDVALQKQDIRNIAEEAPDRAALARTASNKPAEAPTTQVSDPAGARDGLEARKEAVAAANGRAEAATAATSAAVGDEEDGTRQPKILPNGHIDDTSAEANDNLNGGSPTPIDAFKTPSGNIIANPIDRQFSTQENTKSGDDTAVGAAAGTAAAAGIAAALNGNASSTTSASAEPTKAHKTSHDGAGFSAFMNKIVHPDGDHKSQSGNANHAPSERGRITVLLFAAARDAAGHSTLNLELPTSPYPLKDLTTLLGSTELKDPQRLQEVLKRSQWSVDQSMLSVAEVGDVELRGGEEVAVIPPVSGG